MKNKLLATAVLLLGISACQDNDLVNERTPIQTGDEIRFSARQDVQDVNDVDNPGQRTVYGLWEYNTEGNKTYPIYWEDNDIIAIYCPQASYPVPERETDYKITNLNEKDKSLGTLAKLEEHGLQWGEGLTDEEGNTGRHHFFGFYPSSSKQGIIDNTHLKLNLPTLQTPIALDEVPGLKLLGGGTYNAKIARPNMNYCYLYAHNIVSKTDADGNAGQVSLDFKPLVTTLEIIVHGPEEAGKEALKVTQVVVRSSQPLCGDFSLQIAEDPATFGSGTADADGHTNAIPNGELNTQVTIPTYFKNETTGEMEPVELNPGEVLIVRAFLLPYNNVETAQTEVTVHMLGKGSRTKILNTGVIQKHCINITELPYLEGADGNYWMSQLDKNTYFSQLSIPGSHNSYNYPFNRSIVVSQDDNATISPYYQSKTFAEQFAQGARAFSFLVGFAGKNPPIGLEPPAVSEKGWNSTNLAQDYPLYVYAASNMMTATDGSYLTFKKALTDLAKALTDLNAKYPGKSYRQAQEFAILNINPAQYGDRQSFMRLWLKELDDIIDGVNEDYGDIVTNNIGPESTIDDLKGKIIVFVNYQGDALPLANDKYHENPKYPEYSGVTTNFAYNPKTDAGKYVFLWETKDAEGYFGTVNADITTTGISFSDKTTKGIMNLNDRDYDFIYAQPLSGDGITDKASIYKQNLERMSNPKYTGLATGLNIKYDKGDSEGEKRTERKKTMMESLFKMAIENNKEATGLGNWYLNNLGGFCVVNHSNSYSPSLGEGGNTILAANIMNGTAYQYLSNTENNSAPCGIVLMNFFGQEDRLSSEGEQLPVYGVSLPQIIVENNYRFALKVKSSTSTDNSGNSGTTDDSGTTGTQRARSASSNGWDY